MLVPIPIRRKPKPLVSWVCLPGCSAVRWCTACSRLWAEAEPPSPCWAEVPSLGSSTALCWTQSGTAAPKRRTHQEDEEEREQTAGDGEGEGEAGGGGEEEESQI